MRSLQGSGFSGLGVEDLGFRGLGVEGFMQAVIRQSKRERRMDDYHVNELQINRTECEYPCLPGIARAVCGVSNSDSM